MLTTQYSTKFTAKLIDCSVLEKATAKLNPPGPDALLMIMSLTKLHSSAGVTSNTYMTTMMTSVMVMRSVGSEAAVPSRPARL